MFRVSSRPSAELAIGGAALEDLQHRPAGFSAFAFAKMKVASSQKARRSSSSTALPVPSCQKLLARWFGASTLFPKSFLS